MKTTKEMTKEEIQEILDEKVDWEDVHTRTVFSNYGDTIHIRTDGTVFELGSGTYLRDYSEIIGRIPVVGYGDIDDNDYLDGWGEWDRDNDTFTTSDGRILTIEEAIQEAIEDGEWTSLIEEWKQSVMEEYLECVEYEEYQENMKELIKKEKETEEQRLNEQKEKNQKEKERIDNIFKKAKISGKRQLLEKFVTECDNPKEECNTDIICKYAMPDGSTTTTINHTW